MYQEEVFSCRKTDRHTQGNILFQAFEGKKSKIKMKVEHLVFMSRHANNRYFGSVAFQKCI